MPDSGKDNPLHKPLEEFPVKNGFRQRGIDMTRIETFTDAAFAFAVTLMVVSFDAIPSSYDELMDAMLGIPAFALSFLLLMMFWYAHWAWSRRYGLEDMPTIILSCLLVFITLCYIYPLRYLFSGMMTWMSDGKIPSGQQPITLQQLYNIFALYGIGYVLMCSVIILLNLHALRKREALQLSPVEIFDTKETIVVWMIMAGVGLLSICLALILTPSVIAAPGWVFMLLAIVMPIQGIIADRKRATLLAGP